MREYAEFVFTIGGECSECLGGKFTQRKEPDETELEIMIVITQV